MRFKLFLDKNLFENSVNLHGDVVKVKGKEVGCLKKNDGKFIFSTTDNNKQEFDSLHDFYKYVINKYKIKIGKE